MSEPEINKDYLMEKKTAVEFLRDVAEAIEEGKQLNIELEDKKLAQPLTGKIPLRVYQDDEGTEIGFRLNNK